MQPPQHHSRINLAEIKAQIVRKLGPDGSNQYFYYLNRLLSLKLTKFEFNKLCLRIIGRENIQLHNQFIRSILKNACSSKLPPPAHFEHDSKSVRASSHEHDQKGSKFSINGEILQLSPRKSRTGIRDRCKTNLSTAQPSKPHLDFENGPISVHSKNKVELLVIENGKEVLARSLLRAPLGVPFCPASLGGARRIPPLSNSTSDSGDLTLRERMQQIATSRGLQGELSSECANALNSGLEAYLKGLIKACFELVGPKNRAPTKLVNGVIRPDYVHRISMFDFRVAMELNPQQLGEDWPLLLEKICTNSFEE